MEDVFPGSYLCAGSAPARLAKGFQSEGRRCAAGPSCSATTAAADLDSRRSAMARSSFWRRVGRVVGLPCLHVPNEAFIRQPACSSKPFAFGATRVCVTRAEISRRERT